MACKSPQSSHKTLPHTPIQLIETMEGKMEGKVGGMLDVLQNRHKTNCSWLLKRPPQTERQIFWKNMNDFFNYCF